jgi:hypothetical protein
MPSNGGSRAAWAAGREKRELSLKKPRHGKSRLAYISTRGMETGRLKRVKSRRIIGNPVAMFLVVGMWEDGYRIVRKVAMEAEE